MTGVHLRRVLAARYPDVAAADIDAIVQTVKDTDLVLANMRVARVRYVAEDEKIPEDMMFAERASRTHAKVRVLVSSFASTHVVALGPAWYGGDDPYTVSWDGRCLVERCPFESSLYFDKVHLDNYIEQASDHVYAGWLGRELL